MKWMVLFIALSVTVALAQNILIWQNDNQSTFYIPEESLPVKCDYGIKSALAANDYFFTAVTALPEDLSPFDVVFITLGFSVDCG